MDTSMQKKRVVITGMGVLTALGRSVEDYWSNLLAGKSGISTLERIDTSDLPCKIGGEIKDWDPTVVMDVKEARRNDRYTQFAVYAAREAVKQSGLDMSKEDPYRVGVFMGSGIGGMETIESQANALFTSGPRRISPFMIPMLIANIGSGVVAIDIGAKGPNYGVVSACATGTHAIGEALRLIRYGDADVMVAGGSEAAITRLGFGGFCKMKAMSTNNDNPQQASRPFDSGRDGFVMGEGAGALVIESLEHAQARGATILAELVGYGATCDAYHITAPDTTGEGLAKAVQVALADGGLESSAVDYINAHGTSTPYNDKIETQALKLGLGEESARKAKVSSTKSMTGHLLGAAGAVEAVACIQSIRTGEIAPTINLENQDEECDLDYVPNVKQSHEVNVAVSTNLGFGGHNACAAFKKFEG